MLKNIFRGVLEKLSKSHKNRVRTIVQIPTFIDTGRNSGNSEVNAIPVSWLIWGPETEISDETISIITRPLPNVNEVIKMLQIKVEKSERISRSQSKDK